ncbi:unnamed protein product [Anisakis simplex]|uniref:Uncharacterized protein n=1 Tax=Anisakis simplex TaxID=6269 RepID=A0A0M3K335_ANISI|nr:unnamed protein product [Anisakis simplex]
MEYFKNILVKMLFLNSDSFKYATDCERESDYSVEGLVQSIEALPCCNAGIDEESSSDFDDKYDNTNNKSNLSPKIDETSIELPPVRELYNEGQLSPTDRDMIRPLLIDDAQQKLQQSLIRSLRDESSAEQLEAIVGTAQLVERFGCVFIS